MAYTIRSLTSRISYLRRLGLPIKAEWRQDAVGRRYKRYSRGVGFVKRLKELKRKGLL